MPATGNMAPLNRKLNGIKTFITVEALTNTGNADIARVTCTDDFEHPPR